MEIGKELQNHKIDNNKQANKKIRTIKNNQARLCPNPLCANSVFAMKPAVVNIASQGAGCDSNQDCMLKASGFMVNMRNIASFTAKGRRSVHR